MATMNTADIGFEREIWKAADKMRGNIDASEYKSVVLGLIFLKYISDKFETKYRQLVAEGEGFEEDKDEYTAEISSMSRPKPAGSGLRPRRTRPK
jgi:type I restriction enzyme M protein